jgi:Tol biopolymer transport system component
MYRSVKEKPSLRVRLLICLLGLSLLLLSACGGQVSAKGGADDDEDNDNESANSGATRNGQIVFRRWFDPDHRKGALFTMNPDGSHVHQITHPPEGWRDDAPAWSPDGERIAFHRQKSDESTSRIMLLNPDTGSTRQVTHSVPQGKQCTSQCLGGLDPAFSPEGDSLSFHRLIRPDKACCEIEGIWIIGTDGSDPHQLTNVDPKLPAVFADWGSAFSPDGKRLVFDRLRKADERHAIFVQPIDSPGSPQDAQRITPWNLNCQDHPEYSPDGKLVLFRCLPKGEEGPSNLYWVHPDGTGLHALSHAPADKQYGGPGFSPSFHKGEGWITGGRTSGYGKEGNADVFRILIEDGKVVRKVNLTKTEKWDSAPAWGTHPPVG